jgi:hypothetical protein
VIVGNRVTTAMGLDRILVVEGGGSWGRGPTRKPLTQGSACTRLQRRKLLAETLAADDLLAAAGDAV